MFFSTLKSRMYAANTTNKIIILRFNCFVPIFKEFDKPAVLQVNGQKKPDIYGDTVDNRTRRSLCFLLARDTVGMHPLLSTIIFRHFPKCFLYSVSVIEKVFNTQWTFPK